MDYLISLFTKNNNNLSLLVDRNLGLIAMSQITCMRNDSIWYFFKNFIRH